MNFWEYITNKDNLKDKIKYIIGIALLLIFIIGGCVMCHMEDKKDDQPGQETGINEDEEGLTSEYTGDDTEEWLTEETDDVIDLDKKGNSDKKDNSGKKEESNGLQVNDGNQNEEESDEKVDHSTGNNPSVEEAPGDTEWGRLF